MMAAEPLEALRSDTSRAEPVYMTRTFQVALRLNTHRHTHTRMWDTHAILKDIPAKHTLTQICS